MIPALKSEFRKLTSVRSTLVISLLVLAITGLVTFWAKGFRAYEPQLGDPNYLHDAVLICFNFVAVFTSIVAILLVTHEYRYNTIIHTLLAGRRRVHTLLAKTAVVTAYSVALSLLVIVVAIGLVLLGTKLAGTELAYQNLNIIDLLRRAVFYSWAYSMYGLLLGFLIRNQVATIVSLLIGSSAVEALLSLVLKGNAKFLPFSAADAVLRSGNQAEFSQSLTSGTAALVVLAYIVVAWAAAWICLRARDAN